MRYKQYINEDVEEQRKREYYNILKVLYDDCMPFINDLIRQGWDHFTKADPLMYSGRNSSMSVIVGEIRKDRKPSDTEQIKHEMYDDMFYEKFKIRGRSNAIFCTGTTTTASGYGSNVYMIFPVGKYKFIWSNSVRDLYQDLLISRIEWEYDDKYQEWLRKQQSKEAQTLDHPNTIWYAPDWLQDQFEKEIKNKIISTYSNKDILKALRSKKEIMVSGKTYVGLDHMKYQYGIKTYMGTFKNKYPTQERFDTWWERYM